MDTLVAKLYKSPRTILTSKDLALVWKETNSNNLKSKIAYYTKQGILIRLTRGVFAKDKNMIPGNWQPVYTHLLTLALKQYCENPELFFSTMTRYMWQAPGR